MADSYRLKRDYKAFFETLTELVRDENTDEEQKYQAVTGALGGFDQRTFISILPQIDSASPRPSRAASMRTVSEWR